MYLRKISHTYLRNVNRIEWDMKSLGWKHRHRTLWKSRENSRKLQQPNWQIVQIVVFSFVISICFSTFNLFKSENTQKLQIFIHQNEGNLTICHGFLLVILNFFSFQQLSRWKFRKNREAMWFIYSRREWNVKNILIFWKKIPNKPLFDDYF